MAQQTTDYATAFKAMAERAAEESLRTTAGILHVPVHKVHRFLDDNGLRLLCISVAHEAMALYAKQQLAEAEQLRKDRFDLDDTDLAQQTHDERKQPIPEHPGC